MNDNLPCMSWPPMEQTASKSEQHTLRESPLMDSDIQRCGSHSFALNKQNMKSLKVKKMLATYQRLDWPKLMS